MDNYITEFEYLTAQIPKLPEKQFQGYFLHGLKEEIKGKVRSMSVMGNLSRAKLLQVARAVERETVRDGSGFARSSKPGQGSSRFGSVGPNKGGASDWVLVKGGKEAVTKPTGPGPRNERLGQGDRRSGPRDRGFTHLSYNEIMERRRKNQCFKCAGPFSSTHQCPDKHLRLLITDDGGGEESELLAVEVEDGEEEIEGEMSLMSFH